VVFIHGVGVNGDLWRRVAPQLAGEHRCVVPDLPWGAHSLPLRPDADLSLPGMARIVADFMAALELHDVTIVANDTGGAVAQSLVGRHAERIARLVLTSCDAFEHFPPPMLKPLFVQLRLPGGAIAALTPLRIRAARRLPIAYGYLTHGAIPDAPSDSYVLPALASPHVREDLVRVSRGIDPCHTIQAAERLRAFDRPALIAWSADDKFFPRADGERLAATIPGARFELVEGARTFSPEDRPERLAELIAAFARESKSVGSAA
jgi:pimeloyl-ACP methyl ester carboxylesterase